MRDVYSFKRGTGIPLRSSAEIAEMLGITLHQFSAILGHDKNAPKPKLNNRDHSQWSGSKVCWYDPKEMRKWWAQRNANKTTGTAT
jgi:hypothetical protein